MQPLEIIQKYYSPESVAYRILLTHSQSVAQKALAIAHRQQKFKLDITFIEEAALLHDIGIFLTNAPDIDCHGQLPYICHGYAGADILRQAGYPRHALVCERHTGSGITSEEIKMRHLPLPANREMLPLSLEEKLICYADKFFSKSVHLTREKEIEQIRREMLRFGQASLDRFETLHVLFS